ncbi:hypothetical protein ANN_25016 [Periplaneta americana]|uniref:Uncharacterized protein n=1 Tax=Periplaneta americana TaxID=6978 RepID=A0ABQ8S0S9_PERAM|nr:hypothetical protein ANN_25016 [Periplaneta americana]
MKLCQVKAVGVILTHMMSFKFVIRDQKQPCIAADETRDIGADEVVYFLTFQLFNNTYVAVNVYSRLPSF